jgi:hypothetical protein
VTAAAEPKAIIVRAPLPHQEPFYDSPCQYKVARWGRRAGKTVVAFGAAMVGHGPLTNGEPLHRGVSQGGDVLWICRDIPQGRIVWHEEIVPRLEGVPHVTLNHTNHDADLAGCGRLLLRSAENIESVKGSGQNLLGAVIDEAAWLDLQDVLLKVVMPALMDNNGWLIIISTTNGGQDGNTEKIAPSYFNRLCQAIMDGEKGPEWGHWHLTARENPKIGPQKIAALIAEYPLGSVKCKEEVEAELVVGGMGVAFPEWRSDLHISRREAPGEFRWFGGLDWGYASPSACVLVVGGGDQQVIVRKELSWNHTDPYEAGHNLGSWLLSTGLPLPEWIACDEAMWQVQTGGPTIGEEMQRGVSAALPSLLAVPLIATPKGKGSRVAGKMLLHGALKWGPALEDGTVPAHLRPRLTVHPDCPYLTRTLPVLPVSPDNSEDVDTTADDHVYDALRYALMSRTPRTQREARDVPVGRHPGFERSGAGFRRRARHESEDDGLGYTTGYGAGPRFTVVADD